MLDFLSLSLCQCVQRITIEEIRNDEWFKKGYVPVRLPEHEDVNLDDINAAFDDSEVVRFSYYVYSYDPILWGQHILP